MTTSKDLPGGRTAESATTRAAAPAGGTKFRRGVSFYSYQILYHTGHITTEGLVAEASSIGAYELEMLPDCNIPNWPNVTNEWIKQWHGWMDKYHTVADTYTQHLDFVDANRLLWDIDLAKKLGFRNIRLMLGTPVEIVEKCLPAAEKANIPLLIEVHGPVRIESPQVQNFIKLMDKMKSAHLGINPDFSLWEKKPSPVKRDLQIRGGVLKADIAKYIDKACADNVPKDKAAGQVKAMGGGKFEVRYLDSRYNGYQDPQKLLALKPYVRRFHGKFYEMGDDYRETSIPYEEVMPFLIQNGFGGVIVSEYEGARMIMDAFPTDEIEQVRRHQYMLRRLLGEVPTA